MENLDSIYRKLLDSLGPQDWWPMQRGFRPPAWEVCAGAILTQNTSWKNAENALALIKERGFVTPEAISAASIRELESAVRPSGFYRQKAERLKMLSVFFMKQENITRSGLLGVKGIGPETADSILLYALGRPVFVIDSYTKRVFTRLGHGQQGSYDSWQRFFHAGLPKDVKIYKEFHALIVELAKQHCRKKPVCDGCPLRGMCKKIL